TASGDFHTLNPTQAGIGGLTDAFVAVIPTASTTGGFSTYLGGSGLDRGTGIAVDANGATYVAGETASSNFPMASPFQNTPKGSRDAFVAKLGSLSDVEISVAATPTVGGTPTVGVGNQATFTYTITNNNGPDTASAVTFTDTLPTANATFNSVTASTGASCTSP